MTIYWGKQMLYSHLFLILFAFQTIQCETRRRLYTKTTQEPLQAGGNE